MLLAAPLLAAAEEHDKTDQAATSREQSWRQRREQKTLELVPPEESKLAGILKRFDRKGHDSIEDANLWGFRPRIDWIAPNSSMALGVRYWQPELLGPLDVLGSAYYSLRDYQHYDLSLGLIPNRGKKIPPNSLEREDVAQLGDIGQDRFSHFRLYATARYRDLAEERFYGLGPDTNPEALVTYQLKDLVFDLTAGYQFTRSFGVFFKLGHVDHRLGLGGLTDEELPGLREVPDYLRGRLWMTLDLRDNPGVPRKGAYLAFGFERWDQTHGVDGFNFDRYGLDARGYIPLGSLQRVLALRTTVIISEPDEGQRVPFFLRPTLGDSRTLRGFANDRFRGEDVMLYQLEYRWHASPYLELALFVDTGTVSAPASSLSFDELKTDYGIGVRLMSTQSVLLRFDIARSNEDTRFLVRFGGVF